MKIGIIGYTNETSGIGVFVKEYVDNLGIKDILSISSVKGREKWSARQVNAPHPPSEDILYNWLKNSNIDTLIAMETPFNKMLFKMTQALNIKSVVQIHHEWFTPEDSVWDCCDIFLCPNKSAFDKAKRFGDKRILCKIPIDVNNFPYHKRTGKTFIHIAGYFGFMGRKSVEETIGAFSKSVGKKLIIYMQQPISELPSESRQIIKSDNRIEIRHECKNPHELYADGDIAIQPSKFEGYGRTIIEPLACGIPVITLDADPMNTFFDEKQLLLPVIRTEKVSYGNFNTEKNYFSVKDLIDKINWCMKNDISKLSLRARKYVEKNYSWEAQREVMMNNICQKRANIEPMHIVMFTSYDPEGIAWNLSQAINATTPHTVEYFRKTNNYLDYPFQYETGKDIAKAKEAVKTADIIHSHLHFIPTDVFETNKDARCVLHHHGTLFRNNHKKINETAKAKGVLQLVSNLELLKYSENLNYLENPVPFAKYNQMTKGRKRGKTFKIAHSPASRESKGTKTLLKVIENLKGQKIPVELILIEKASHKECLKRKAEADLTFDSFELGLQMSGLEAACFNQPVIAGNEYVKKASIEKYGYCPYTFATEKTLEKTIKKFILNKEFYEEEKKRIVEHVKKYHDYESVARRYFEILDVKPKVVEYILKEGTDGIYVKMDIDTLYKGAKLRKGDELEVSKDVARRWIDRGIATLIDKRFF